MNGFCLPYYEPALNISEWKNDLVNMSRDPLRPNNRALAPEDLTVTRPSLRQNR